MQMISFIRNAGGVWLGVNADRAGHRAPSHAQKKFPFGGC
nr:MAG TPA: hypothetical protein [Caudoviricetes sp.]